MGGWKWLFVVTFFISNFIACLMTKICQVDSLRQRCELQELELQKSTKKAQEAMALAADESAKSRAAKEVIKSLTGQVIS